MVNLFCLFFPSYIWNFAFSETIYFLQIFAYVLSVTTLIATKVTHLKFRWLKWCTLVLTHIIILCVFNHLQVIWSKTFVTCSKFCTMYLSSTITVTTDPKSANAISRLARTLLNVIGIEEAHKLFGMKSGTPI